MDPLTEFVREYWPDARRDTKITWQQAPLATAPVFLGMFLIHSCRELVMAIQYSKLKLTS